MSCGTSGTHLELQYRNHITIIFLISSFLCHLVHHPHFKTGDMKSVKAITSGGAYFLPQFADQICSHFTDIPRVGEGMFSTYCVQTCGATVNLHRLRHVGIHKSAHLLLPPSSSLTSLSMTIAMKPIPGILDGCAQNKPDSVVSSPHCPSQQVPCGPKRAR
jgi:hypothetical protein